MFSRWFGRGAPPAAPSSTFSVASLVALHDAILKQRSLGAAASPTLLVESVRSIGEVLV